MAIIRNERSRQQKVEQEVEAQVEEEQIDYRWHPTEEEFTSPLTADQWAELLGDATFAETDAAKAVRCLRDYGEPATFQQLSIRYRGTMGRYRRWLGEAAQEAGQRFGVEAPQKDQFGMDEWWPLLYVTRATGKPGAGVFEMQLRPEVEDAYRLIDEQEKQAKRAENARQLQRIEQLERARREERERHAAEAAKASAPAEADETAVASAPAPAAPAPVKSVSVVRTVAEVAGQNEPPAPTVPKVPADEPDASFVALNEFLDVMAEQDKSGMRYVSNQEAAGITAFDAAVPLDYALRYAERLRSVLALMRDGFAGTTAAAIARELGDDSVAHMQAILNGEEIPSFDYLDNLKRRLFVNLDYLEATEGTDDSLPRFCTYQELLFETQERADLAKDLRPQQIAYVVDDSKNRRTGVIVRFSPLRCVLLSRGVVNAESRNKKNVELEAFVRMVDELDTFARENGIARTSHTVSSAEWNELIAGRIWPGAAL